MRVATGRAVAHGTVAHLLSRPGLGLLSTTRPVHVADQVTVHPRLFGVADVPVTQHRVPGTGAPLAGGGGPEVLGVREWRSGDDHRWVHWRSTARSGRLTVLERGDAEAAGLRLVLIGSDRAAGFEDLLSTAASLCDRALRSGRPVTAVAWHVNGPLLAPARSRWDLLDWWSSVTDTVLPDPTAVRTARPRRLRCRRAARGGALRRPTAGGSRPPGGPAPAWGCAESRPHDERSSFGAAGAAAVADRHGCHSSRSDRLPRCPRPAAPARRGPRDGADRGRRLAPGPVADWSRSGAAPVGGASRSPPQAWC